MYIALPAGCAAIGRRCLWFLFDMSSCPFVL